MKRIPHIPRSRNVFTLVLSTVMTFLSVAALSPTRGGAQAPAYCYLSTPLELTPGGGAQATFFTRSGHVLGLAPDASGQYRRFVYNGTGIHDLDAALGSGGQFIINESHKAMSEEGSVFGVGSDDATVGQYAVVFDDDGVHRITLGGTFGVAIDINDAGQATGAATNEDETTLHAFRYDHGTLTDLGTLGGARSYPHAISENGKIAGASTNAQGEQRAFLYDEGGIHDLGVLPGGTWSIAFAVNDAGQVAGVSEVAGGGQHAFLYDGTTMHDLGTLPGGTSSFATHINALGQVVGWADTPDSGQSVFLYDGTTMLNLTPNAARGDVLRFSDSGVVVGQAYTPNHVFVYDATGLHNISLGGTASDAHGSFGGFGVTNRSGLVAGAAYMPGNTTRHAFLYDGSALHDLNSLPGDYGEALGINETGQVVGTFDQGAFLYQNGVMTNVNDSMCVAGVTFDSAYGISDDGKILAANPYQGQLYLLTRRRISNGFARPYGG